MLRWLRNCHYAPISMFVHVIVLYNTALSTISYFGLACLLRFTNRSNVEVVGKCHSVYTMLSMSVYVWIIMSSANPHQGPANLHSLNPGFNASKANK